MTCERAKMFAPFDALKGFREELAKKECIKIHKKDLLEDQLDLLDETIQKICPGNMVSVIYYHPDGYYEKITGLVSDLSLNEHWIIIVKRFISFEDIYDIQLY